MGRKLDSDGVDEPNSKTFSGTGAAAAKGRFQGLMNKAGALIACRAVAADSPLSTVAGKSTCGRTCTVAMSTSRPIRSNL